MDGIRHFGVVAMVPLALFVVSSCADSSSESGDDRAVLVEFYEATGGANWGDNTNWNTDAPLDQWYGVSTDTSGRVTRLELSGNQLSASIPAALGGLTNLVELRIAGNQFSGSIPAALCSFAEIINPQQGGVVLPCADSSGESGDDLAAPGVQQPGAGTVIVPTYHPNLIVHWEWTFTPDTQNPRRSPSLPTGGFFFSNRGAPRLVSSTPSFVTVGPRGGFHIARTTGTLRFEFDTTGPAAQTIGWSFAVGRSGVAESIPVVLGGSAASFVVTCTQTATQDPTEPWPTNGYDVQFSETVPSTRIAPGDTWPSAFRVYYEAAP